MRRRLIVYTGQLSSGRVSSIYSIETACGIEPRKLIRDHDLDIGLREQLVPVTLVADRQRGALAYGDQRDPSLDHYLKYEIERLKRCDGIVFVVDSQTYRMDMNVQSFYNLMRDLRFHERDLSTVPIMIQANKRDELFIESMDEIKRKFHTPRCAYSETVADQGKGVIESLRTLLQMMIDT